MTDINYLKTKKVREPLDLDGILPNPSKADDYKIIGKDIREKLHHLAKQHVLPAIIAHLKLKNYEKN